MASSWKGVKRF
jgi:chaperone required for assembly of F1-ATPase